jgi:hypothetical protein
LYKVRIPVTVESMGVGAFSWCGRLVEVAILCPLTKIPESAFTGCFSLRREDIPESVTGIGKRAFRGCRAQADIALRNVTSIGREAFRGCESLSTLTVSPQLSVVGDYAFTDRSELRRLALAEPPGAMTAFVGRTADADAKGTIGAGAFQGCTNLVEAAIPPGIASLGDRAFAGCGHLTKLSVPSSVTSLGESVFEGAATHYLLRTGFHCPEPIQGLVEYLRVIGESGPCFGSDAVSWRTRLVISFRSAGSRRSVMERAFSCSGNLRRVC